MAIVRIESQDIKKLEDARDSMKNSDKDIKKAMEKTIQASNKKSNNSSIIHAMENAIKNMEDVQTKIKEIGNREDQQRVNSLLDKMKGDISNLKKGQIPEKTLVKLQEIQQILDNETKKIEEKTRRIIKAENENQTILVDMAKKFGNIEKNLKGKTSNTRSILKKSPNMRMIASTSRTSGGGGLKSPTSTEFLDDIISGIGQENDFLNTVTTKLQNNNFNWNEVIKDIGADKFFTESRKTLKSYKGGKEATSYDKVLTSMGYNPEHTYAALMQASYDAAGGNKAKAAAYMAMTHHELLAPILGTLGTRDAQLKGPLVGFNCATGSMFFHIAAMNGGNYTRTQEFIKAQSSAGNYVGSVAYAYQVTITEGNGQRMSFDETEVGDLCMQLANDGRRRSPHVLSSV